jgi:hypothetical protein
MHFHTFHIATSNSRSDVVKLKAKCKIRRAATLLFYTEEGIL